MRPEWGRGSTTSSSQRWTASGASVQGVSSPPPTPKLCTARAVRAAHVSPTTYPCNSIEGNFLREAEQEQFDKDVGHNGGGLALLGAALALTSDTALPTFSTTTVVWAYAVLYCQSHVALLGVGLHTRFQDSG